MNILRVYRHHPVTMARYFKEGFKALGHNVISAGFSTGMSIPWTKPDGSMFTYPNHADNPELFYLHNQATVTLKEISDGCKSENFSVDLVVAVDAGYFVKRTGDIGVPFVTIGTDPHALNYKKQRQQSDVFFCMQDFYKQEEDVWLPYAFDPALHYYYPKEQNFDICFIGILYTDIRRDLAVWLQHKYKAFMVEGIIREECNDIYNEALIGFNLSSQEDLPARFYEDMARRRLVLTNRVPDLALWQRTAGLTEDVHYVAYSDLPELTKKLDYYITHKGEADKIAREGWIWIHTNQNTYMHRCETIIEKAFA